MADTNFVYDPNKAQYDAIKTGGMGGNGLLDMAIMAYQAAFPKAPAANLLAGGRQAYNLHKYNNQVAAAQAAKQKQEADRLYALNQYVQTLGGPKATAEDGSAVSFTEDQLKQVQELTGNKQGLEGLANMGKGQDPNFGALTPMDQARQAIGEYILKPGIASNQNTATLDQINQANPYQLGQPVSQGLADLQNQPQLDDGTGNPVLSASTKQTVLPPAPLSPMQRFTSGLYAPDAKDVVSGATQKETGQHNRNTEQQAKDQLAEMKKYHDALIKIGQTNAQAHMISAKKPSGGGGGRATTSTEATLGLARQLGLNPQQTLQLLNDPSSFDYEAAGVPAPVIQNGFNPKAGVAGMMMNPVSQMGKSPFGGGSRSKLQKSSQDLSRSIYPGKR